MTFQVFHKNEPTFMDADIKLLAQTFPAGFTHVANVECDVLGAVFQLTNHIDSDWTKNPEVVLYGTTHPRGNRSTSVGDVVVAPDGTRHVCRMVGWEQFR